MDKLLKFPDCPCVFPIREHPNGYIQPLVNFSYSNIQDCPKVWDLYASGLLTGVFQLESNLGKKWAKELKPTSISHLEALVSILRPSCLNAYDENGISLTQKYCDRKNGKSPNTCEFPALEEILKSTYNLMIYQEDAMAIAHHICGFTLTETDSLIRKSLGKKDAKLLLSIEDKFINGAKQVGKISMEDAKRIFDWLKAGARYSFNKSHASGYAIRSYNEAYLKTHFPVAFYTSKLKSPRNSKVHEDINDLVYEAKQFGIETGLPDLRDARPEFYHDGSKIFFGLTDIKSFGQSGFSAVADMVSKCGPQVWENFFEFSINSSRYLTDSVVKLLIKAGAVDFFGMTRSQMLEEYELVSKLTKTEKINLFRYYDAEKLGVFDTKSEISSDE